MRKSLRSIAVITTVSVTMAFGVSAANASDVTTTTGVEQLSAEQAPGGEITEVRDGSGNVVGYQVDEATRAALSALDQELQSRQDARSAATLQGAQVAVDGWRILKCTASISGFLALTVFPSARAAKLAVRIGGLVRKHGVKKVAQILTRTYRGSDVNAEAIFKEIAKEAAGVAALEVCFGG